MSKGEETRERVLEEADRLITTRGIRATSVKDLLAETGVARGSLYHHFPGKDDLGVAVLERARERFMAFLEKKLSDGTPGERLVAFLNGVLSTHREAEFVGGCIFGNTALEMADRSDVYAHVVRDVFGQWVGRLRDVIAEGQRGGEVRSDLPAEVIANHMVSALEGGIMLSRLEKDERPLAATVECLVGFLRNEEER